MKKKEETTPKKKSYDFTRCREEVTIGVFVESDLSKTVANYIHQHTGDIAVDDFARKLYYDGKVEMTPEEVAQMAENISKSNLSIAVKQAVLELLKC